MSAPVTDWLHNAVTQRRQLQYLFAAKHHGADRTAARWLPILTAAEEFSVFDGADLEDLSDGRGWLYGVLRNGLGNLLFLGTWNQQIAEFPSAREGFPWHGYPLYPLRGVGPENRRGERMRPSLEVFGKMVESGVLTPRQKKRLARGKHA